MSAPKTAAHAALMVDYAAGVPMNALRDKYRLSAKTIYWLAWESKTRRPEGWRGRRPAERRAPADEPTGEYTRPIPGETLRAPLLPWYTEQADPTPPPLADLVVRAAPVSRYRRSYVPIWPRAAAEEALCTG